MRRSGFNKITRWKHLVAALGVPDMHFHDLRHTGNTYAAESGASLAELMNRMGHSSTRAAQVYLHARQERDRQIASTLDAMAKQELRKAAEPKPPTEPEPEPEDASGT